MATVTEIECAGETGFPNFPCLPLEIRTEMWEMALDYPRVVTFLPAHLFEEGQTQRKSLTPSPALLYVCSESRSVARKAYVSVNKDNATTPVLVNPDIDKVYVSCWGPDFLCADFKDLDLSSVKSLAVMYEDLGLRPIGQMASLTELAVVGLRPVDILPTEPLNESVLGAWMPGSINILQDIERLINIANTKEVAEVAILVCPPLTQRPDPCQTYIQLVASQLKMCNQHRPAYSDLERSLEELLNEVIRLDGSAVALTIHPSAVGSCSIKFQSYFVTATPWPASRCSEDYPSDSLSRFDGLGLQLIWVQKDMPGRRLLHNLRVYKWLDVPGIESPKVTAVDVPTREGYKWWIMNWSSEWERLCRPDKPVIGDCILIDTADRKPTRMIRTKEVEYQHPT